MSAAGITYAGPKHRRPRLTLYRYVAREALGPTLFALFGLTAVVLTTDILGFSDLVINRGVGSGDVAAMIFYDALPVATRMFPFSVLVGALVALGRLGADREILTLEACGVAAARLVWPVVSFAGAMTVIALWLSASVTPWASAHFDEALAEVSRTKPWAQLHAGTVNEFGGWQLEAREVSPSGDELRGVMLWIPDLGETIFARRGDLAAAADGSIEITLHDGTTMLRADREPRLLTFDSATTVLPESDSGLERDDVDRIPMLPLSELMELANEGLGPREITKKMLRPALELHRRFAYPLATLVFGFLAVPLFLARKNFSRAGGGVMGVICTVTYYGLMQLGDGLVQAGRVGPVLGAWMPNLVLGALATALLVRALREHVGGHAFDRPVPRNWRIFGWLRSEQAERLFHGPRHLALPRYVAWRFLELLALSFSVLLVAYLLIDVLDRLEWFTRHQATMLEAVRFYGARIWLLASRAVPMAILVATSLTVSLLAVEGELIGMRACGISATRGTLPVLLIATIIAPLYFVLNNVVVPRTNALADELKRTEIKERATRERMEARKAGYWYRSGSQLLDAALFDPDRGQARDVTIFDLDEDGLPRSRTDASAARHIGQGWWRLTNPARVERSNGRLVRVPAPRHAQLGDTVQASVDTMHLPVNQIAAEARAVEADGFDATHFWVDYYVRLAEPLSCLVLPAAVLFFSVAGPPFPGPAQTLLVSGIVGVSYILLVAVSSSLGRGGAVPPVVGAWGPIALFGVLAGYLFSRVWRRL